MGSRQETQSSTGVGVELYQWVLDTLSMARARGYRRLNAPVMRKRVRVARLGKKSGRNNGRAAMKMKRRLRLAWFSPFTLLAKLRDTYVNLLKAASSRLVLSEGVAPLPGLPCDFGSSPIPLGTGNLKRQERELDKILELYLARTRSHLLLPNSP